MARVADRVHRLSVEQYVAAAEAPGWERTELIGGVVYDVTPESALHAEAVDFVCDALKRVFGDWRVRSVGSVRLADDSLWEPDAYVAPRVDPLPDYPQASELRLVVEVSVSSSRRDLGAKARAYAANGIHEYWVLVPDVGGHLTRHADPDAGSERYVTVTRVELPSGYRELVINSAGEPEVRPA